jgi:hypothetical protein
MQIHGLRLPIVYLQGEKQIVLEANSAKFVLVFLPGLALLLPVIQQTQPQ